MKANQIYVGKNGATLSLTNGKGVAVYPAQKGEKQSYILMDSGRVATLKGSRINGVGVARFLTENGFELAEPGNSQAAELADQLDVREGTKLVETASQAQAELLRQQFGGKVCTFVPFDAERPCATVEVSPPGRFTTTLFDLTSAFASGTVEVAFNVKNPFGSTLALSSGWLVGPDGAPEDMPRGAEYGGLVEQAVYVICNSGMGSLVGAQNLVMDEDAAEDEPYPRGRLEVALTNGDRLVVGIDALDELAVEYRRADAVVYSRSGMTNDVRLGGIIGAIAAVLVRVNEMDSAPATKPRRKKAA